MSGLSKPLVDPSPPSDYMVHRATIDIWYTDRDCLEGLSCGRSRHPEHHHTAAAGHGRHQHLGRRGGALLQGRGRRRGPVRRLARAARGRNGGVDEGRAHRAREAADGGGTASLVLAVEPQGSQLSCPSSSSESDSSESAADHCHVAEGTWAPPTSTSLVEGTWDQLSEAFGLQSKIEVQVAKEDRRLQEGLRGIINDRGNQMAIQSAAAQSAELSGMDYEMLVQVGLACLSFVGYNVIQSLSHCNCSQVHVAVSQGHDFPSILCRAF